MSLEGGHFSGNNEIEFMSNIELHFHGSISNKHKMMFVLFAVELYKWNVHWFYYMVV